jgi:hypothetical protein
VTQSASASHAFAAFPLTSKLRLSATSLPLSIQPVLRRGKSPIFRLRSRKYWSRGRPEVRRGIVAPIGGNLKQLLENAELLGAVPDVGVATVPGSRYYCPP